MTPNEFVMWFKGFSEACHHLNATPQQWEKIIETLKTVKEEDVRCACEQKTYTYPFMPNNTGGSGGFVHNTNTNDVKTQLND